MVITLQIYKGIVEGIDIPSGITIRVRDLDMPPDAIDQEFDEVRGERIGVQVITGE